MTKMLAWPNTKRLSRICSGLIHMEETKRGRKAPLRRRNRARESEQVRREVNAVELTCPKIGCRHRYHDSYWSMNDDSQTPSAEVWQALVENEQGLRFVDFDGTYRTETQ